MTDNYADDRPGLMRIHVADERGRLACARYTRNALRAHAKAHGVTTAFRNRYKRDLAWAMAQHGLIAPDGSLRDSFPAQAVRP